MNTQRESNMNLAAPCGMYCGTCRQYLVRIKNKLAEKKLKAGCTGCRIRDKNCSFVKRDCKLLKKKEIDFCYECDNFPCENLMKISELYIKRYNMSFVENLKRIKKIGVQKWIDEMEEKFKCQKCGGIICIHDFQCYDCGDKITLEDFK